MNETRTLWDMLEMDRIEKASLDGPTSLAQRVRNAWYDQMNRPVPMPEYDGWIEEVFEEYVIVCMGEGDYYRYYYTVDQDGAIVFGEPERVERRYVPMM